MFSCQERSQNFFRGKAPKFDIFKRRFFGRVSLKQNEDSRGGVRGHALSQNFKNFAFYDGHFSAS